MSPTNGVLAFNRLDNVIFAPPISGSGGVTQMGPGVLVLTNAQNTYTGPTLISGGTLALALALVPSAPAAPTPLAHYTMDGTLGAIASGGTIADSSGNGHTATMTGTGASFVGGVIGQAINFTSPSYLDTGDLGQSSAWTESVWINIPAANISTLAYFTDGRQGGGNGYNLSFYNGGNTLYTRIPSAVGGDVLDIGESFPLSADTWHLLTTTVGSGTFDVYLDGTLKASATYTGTAQFMSVGDGLRIGARSTTGAYQFTGSVDDFNLYSSVLTADQIQRLYANGVSGLPIGTPLQVASGGVFDMGGGVQTVSSLTDGGGGGGRVINSNTRAASTLTLSPTGGTSHLHRLDRRRQRLGYDQPGHERQRVQTLSGPALRTPAARRSAAARSISPAPRPRPARAS